MPHTLMFHVVTAGRCQLLVEGAEPQWLQPGDFVLLPHGAGHQLASAATVRAANLFDLLREQVSERYEILRHGGGGAATNLICGAVRFDHPAAQQLVQLLPKIICINSGHSPQTEWMQSTFRPLPPASKPWWVSRLCTMSPVGR
ncbi:MAG: cupin domain-containing protein [Caldilineaceae bacterium]